MYNKASFTAQFLMVVELLLETSKKNKKKGKNRVEIRRKISFIA
jgi:hypothetical protein